MSRTRTRQAPDDAEILAYNNVPVAAAAAYIGWSTPTLYSALQQGRAPFGCAAQNPETGTWAYNVSPGLLVRYKHGDLPTYRLNEVIDLAVEGFERVLDARLDAAQAVIDNALNSGRPTKGRYVS